MYELPRVEQVLQVHAILQKNKEIKIPRRRIKTIKETENEKRAPRTPQGITFFILNLVKPTHRLWT